MAWKKEITVGTRHKFNCAMTFGRKDATCPRCVELMNGAPARGGWQKKYFEGKRRDEQTRLAAIAAHDCKRAGCLPVCVAFDW